MLTEKKRKNMCIKFKKFKNILFKLIGLALIETLEKGLGDKFTSETKTAWLKIYSYVTYQMIVGLNSARNENY